MTKQRKPRHAEPNPSRKEWAEAQLAEKRRFLRSIEEGKASPETLAEARKTVQIWEGIVRNWVD